MLIRKSGVVAVVILANAAVWRAIFISTTDCPPTLFPTRTKVIFYLNIQLPNAASLQRAELVTAKVEDILAKTPGVRYTTSILGFSLLSLVRTSYNAFIFVTMKDWDDRKTRAEQFQVIRSPEPGAEYAPGRSGVQFLPACDSRSRDLGRVHVHPGRPCWKGRPVFVR